MSLYINPYQSYSSYVSIFQQSNVQQTSRTVGLLKPTTSTAQNNPYASYMDREVKKAQTYLTDMRTGIDKLKKAVGQLTRRAYPLSKIAKSDSDALKVTPEIKNATTSRLTPITVDVKQVATRQINRGEALKADDAATAGKYAFTLKAGSRVKNLSVTINQGDDAKTAQTKLADAINGAKMGVTAKVETDEKAGTSRIVVQSDKAGGPDAGKARPERAVFTLQDNPRTDEKTGVIEALGVGEVSEYAENAVYEVGGVERLSQSNDIALGNGITASLQQVGQATITFEEDTTPLLDNTRAFVEGFNDMVALGEANGGIGGSRLLSELASLSKSYSRSLAGVGISVASNGMLTIDEMRLESSAQDGSLKRLMSESYGTAYGFASRMSSTVSKISANPMRYYQLTPETTPAATSNLFYGAMRVGSNSGLYTGLLLDAML